MNLFRLWLCQFAADVSFFLTPCGSQWGSVRHETLSNPQPAASAGIYRGFLAKCHKLAMVVMIDGSLPYCIRMDNSRPPDLPDCLIPTRLQSFPKMADHIAIVRRGS